MRYLKNRNFPPYAFIPGKFPHPEKKGGYLHGKEKNVTPLNVNLPRNCPDFLYALDLFNHKYFWEAHVWWEALWNQAGRQGEISDFLKALIKIAASGVKEEMGQEIEAKKHRSRAIELLSPLIGKDVYCGIEVSHLVDQLKKDQFLSKIQIRLQD